MATGHFVTYRSTQTRDLSWAQKYLIEQGAISKGAELTALGPKQAVRLAEHIEELQRRWDEHECRSDRDDEY